MEGLYLEGFIFDGFFPSLVSIRITLAITLCNNTSTLQKCFYLAKMLSPCKNNSTLQKQFHLAKTIPPCKNTSIFQKYFHLAKILPPCKNTSTLQKYFHLAKKFSPCKNFFTLQKLLPPCKNTYITEIMHTNLRPTLNLKYVSHSRGCCRKKKYVIGSLHLNIRFKMWFPLTKLLSVKK